MSSNNIVIDVENVTKEYKMYKKPLDRLFYSIFPNQFQHRVGSFKALNNITMKINKGTTVGIVGRNGSGKSTLLQMIAGTLNASQGTIKVDGRVSALLELGAGFNPEFTGRENVYLNGAILGLTKKEIDEKFDAILEFSEIGEFIERPVKTYSSGMFVRLAFSVAAFVEPDIMIIDEALSVGDEKFQRKCYNYLEKLKENGCTILFVSHSMRVVEQLCDYAYLLDKSLLLAEGSPKEIIDQYHMLLYSQENAHYQTLNKIEVQSKKQKENVVAVQEQNDTAHEKEVLIDSIKMYNGQNEETYVFETGSYSEIRVVVNSKIDVQGVLVGLRIKNTQGIEVYGTSTAYHDYEVEFTKDSTYNIIFKQKMQIVAGTYHVSVAIARQDGKADMIYFDKLSDYLIFKVEEMPITGTGIANLNSKIGIHQSI